MASYVDNSFRQAVMKNPAERTSQACFPLPGTGGIAVGIRFGRFKLD